MNQKLLSGFTAALLISTFGLTPSGSASQARTVVKQSRVSISESGAATTQVATTELSENGSTSSTTATPSSDVSSATSELSPSEDGEVVSPTASANQETSPANQRLASIQPARQSEEAVKVGEYQSQTSRADVTVATIQPHQLRGRQAATLYVRNIPVLTFLGGAATSAEANQAEQSAGRVDGAAVKVASVQSSERQAVAMAAQPNSEGMANKSASSADIAANSQNNQDPVWQATATAARLNQLYRDNVSASDIKILWDADHQRYVIKANDTEIVAVNDNTVLPDTIDNAAGDMLQATNRIRRQLGGAEPLSNIEGDPNGFGQVSLGPVSLRVSGYASWYGPGFDGAYSASGEVFNQEAMTAAHPSLPFGTQVKVTNLDNGQSVVVRINDRGPYAHDRVIDLSTGAARIIGLVQSGVAPVSLEVLNRATASN